MTCKLSFSLAVDKAKPFRGNVWHFKVTNFFKSISICISSSFWFIESCWCSKTSSTNFITTMKFGQWPILVACQHNTWPMQLTTFHILHDEKIDGIFQQKRWATRLKSSSLLQDVKHLALYHRWIPNRNFINRIHITKQSSDTFEIVHGRYDVVSSRENFNFNLIFLFICETRFWTVGGIWVFSSYHIHRSLWCSRFFVDCMINNRFFAGFLLNLG